MLPAFAFFECDTVKTEVVKPWNSWGDCHALKKGIYHTARGNSIIANNNAIYAVIYLYSISLLLCSISSQLKPYILLLYYHYDGDLESSTDTIIMIYASTFTLKGAPLVAMYNFLAAKTQLTIDTPATMIPNMEKSFSCANMSSICSQIPESNRYFQYI